MIQSYVLRPALLAANFVGAGNRRLAEPGAFDVWVGQSSEDGLHTQITLYAAAPASA